MNVRGLVWTNGAWRPVPYAEEAMAEAIDDAVGRVVDIAYGKGRMDSCQRIDLAGKLVREVDKRIDDVENRMGGAERGGVDVGAYCRLGQRRERLEELRRRCGGLTLG